MPEWTAVPLDYEPVSGQSDVFVKAASPIDADSLGKTTPAPSTARQAYFHEYLKRISWHLGSRTIPVFSTSTATGDGWTRAASDTRLRPAYSSRP